MLGWHGLCIVYGNDSKKVHYIRSFSPYQRYQILAKTSTLIAEKADGLAAITLVAGKVFRDPKTEFLRADQENDNKEM